MESGRLEPWSLLWCCSCGHFHCGLQNQRWTSVQEIAQRWSHGIWGVRRKLFSTNTTRKYWRMREGQMCTGILSVSLTFVKNLGKKLAPRKLWWLNDPLCVFSSICVLWAAICHGPSKFCEHLSFPLTLRLPRVVRGWSQNSFSPTLALWRVQAVYLRNKWRRRVPLARPHMSTKHATVRTGISVHVKNGELSISPCKVSLPESFKVSALVIDTPLEPPGPPAQNCLCILMLRDFTQ